MKRLHFRLVLTAILLAGSTAIAQDSLKTKTTLKEEGLKVRKRKFQYFVSNRLSEDDKFDLFKFITSDREPSVIIIKGHFENLDKPEKKRVKITVYNLSNNEMVGIYNSNTYTGNYLLVLVPNIKYLFKVESEGFENVQEVVEVPLKFDYETGRQELTLKRNEQKRTVLSVTNYFSDDHEKVFYLRASPDSTKKEMESAGYEEGEGVKGNLKQGKKFSTVDELVKKQLEEEKKKPADALKAFKNAAYETALPLYAALLKNDAGDPFLNYYYGVCLLKSTRNKSKAINSLELAARYNEIPRDVHIYLAEAYHRSYMFKEAMRSIDEYKKNAKPGDANVATLTQLYNNCKSGAMLMSDQVNMEILRRATVQTDNLLANYNPDFINDKLTYKTDFFMQAADKGKAKLLMCKGAGEMYHASYGTTGNNTDIYRNARLPNGSFGAAQPLGPDINTPLDENYPFITKDGKTLYFSSMGLNSMGGYDIFRCTRADSTSPWGKPENLGFPINSAYDDILYVPDPDNRYASFCTNRKSDKFEYIQIKSPQKALAPSIIKGNFGIDSSANKDALITVFNSLTEEIAGVYKTNSENGNYLMVLASGISYYMLIEADNYPEFKSAFVLPEKKGDFILKQVIKFPAINATNGFSVKNYFTEEQASNVNFEDKKPEVKEVVKGKKEPSHTGEIRVSSKLKRTPEEEAIDKQHLKEAQNLFEQSNYQEAALLYKQLELNTELDAIHSYNYGVCLFHARKDKVHCAHLLEKASQGKNVPPDVFYYLGRANHLNYRFSTALKAYQKFAELGKPAEVKKFNLDKEIEHCNNGLKLVNNPVVIEVFDKKHISLESVHMAFTHLESGAKILISTEDLLSSVDKKKNYKPVIFLAPDKNTIYYSSYGENEGHGKDIFCIKKLGNGKWSPTPFNISSINSDYDEEYPALAPDGKTLFFSSKGFNTMGGYDIFKCEWNENTQAWSEPVNLGSPINSPYDDIYFVE